jgi:hypothetical protein
MHHRQLRAVGLALPLRKLDQASGGLGVELQGLHHGVLQQIRELVVGLLVELQRGPADVGWRVVEAILAGGLDRVLPDLLQRLIDERRAGRLGELCPVIRVLYRGARGGAVDVSPLVLAWRL